MVQVAFFLYKHRSNVPFCFELFHFKQPGKSKSFYDLALMKPKFFLVSSQHNQLRRMKLGNQNLMSDKIGGTAGAVTHDPLLTK